MRVRVRVRVRAKTIATIVSHVCFLIFVLISASYNNVNASSGHVMTKEELADLDYILRPHVQRPKSFIDHHHEIQQQQQQQHQQQQQQQDYDHDHDHPERRLQGTALITVAFFFDAFPRETSFTLKTADGSQTLLNYPVGSFNDDQYKNQLWQLTTPVIEGASYTLTVMDQYSDGIFDPGFYVIFYGPTPTDSMQLLKETTFRGSRKEHTFLVTRPQTAPPTPIPPTVSPAPTHLPTTCIDPNSDAWQVLEPQRDQSPRFFSQATAISETPLCQRHTSYQSCTNEQGEDCQWQFLTIGALGGRCRVDPITECLRKQTCKCETNDFNAGPDTMGDGLIFHVPISLTTRDLTAYANHVRYYEYWTVPSTSQTHPPNPDFFISRVDFTSRQLRYEFDSLQHPIPQMQRKTVSFNLHYLYTDTPIIGTIWEGLGLTISINTLTNPQVLVVNGRQYQLLSDLKKWTCTTVVITPNQIYVAGVPYTRSGESSATTSNNILLLGGNLSGELFDVRVYLGALTMMEVNELGARCTNVDNSAALRYKRDIENPYFIYGCNADFNRLPADEGGETTTSGKHTYGSGPYATLWIKPKVDPFTPGTLLDIVEGEFDEEWFFQQKKLQHYIYERMYFDTDMMGGMNQEPYRFHDSGREVPVWSATFWDNPCRYMNNFNNGWQFPIYEKNIPKFTESDHGNNGVFDLEFLYRTRNVYKPMAFWVHEMFHGLQGNLADVYSGSGSRWLAETTAEYAADVAFPSYEKILAPLAFAPSMPLGFLEYRDAARGAHFMSNKLSINEWVRGGTVYGSWVLWWFLSEHAGMPGVIGNVYSNWYNKHSYIAGEIFHVRELVENNNMDFGDVWSIAIAHMRTWDIPNRANDYMTAEAEDFENYKKNPDVQPEIPREYTIENRKTAAEISPFGTGGQFLSGPADLRPGPNGWNAVAMRNVPAGRFITIQLRWRDGMGFQPNQQPTWIAGQQAGCDNDPRFYNSIVIAHNIINGNRRYFKMKGKTPSSVTIQTNALTNIHIILVPTPPTDYIGGIYSRSDNFYDDHINPIPIYSYEYRVDVATTQSFILTPQEPTKNGIINFTPATPGWWPIRCTCMDPPESSHQRCIRPKFDGVGLTPAPGIPTPTHSPTVSPTPNPTASPAVITPVPLPTMPIWTFLPFPRGTPIPSQPLQISTPTPSVSSSITSQSEFCDDDRFAKFFVAETGKEEPCVWLAARPEYIPSLCGEGQEAREKCPESCRVCTDDCEDSTSKFDLDGGKRNCIFLSLRNNLIDQYCVEGTDVYDACPETCDKCDSQVRTAGPPPSSLPQSSNPIPITPIPTTHPTSDPPVPTEGIRCDDDRTTKFWVPSLEKYEPCVWLSARPEEKIILCQPGQEAYRICPETCGVCSDSCEDTDGRFDLNEVSRDCLWLSLRNSVINEVCQPGNEAYSVCPETCDACDTSQ